jgi:hypothetical protein
MKRNQKKTKSIPDEVIEEVQNIVENFNAKNSSRDDCYYEVTFRGNFVISIDATLAIWDR